MNFSHLLMRSRSMYWKEEVGCASWTLGITMLVYLSMGLWGVLWPSGLGLHGVNLTKVQTDTAGVLSAQTGGFIMGTSSSRCTGGRVGGWRALVTLLMLLLAWSHWGGRVGGWECSQGGAGCV